jgi:hypothetical protein
VAVAVCLPMTGLPFGTDFPENNWQFPDSPQGPPAAPLPTASGYYPSLLRRERQQVEFSAEA